ncbi:MAG: hypothetical protein V7746_11355 [Halioglobus sp.]
MSKLELAFLHIPKTAGTSLRRKLNHAYGRDKVFWIGVDCDSSTTKYPEQTVDGRPIIGGHRGISFYPEHLGPIYCSVLRDPLARAISLFAYYTRPDLAKTEGQIRERKKQLARMLASGIEPDSLLRSIENCRPFRAAISNQQCRFLSRGNATAADTLATLSRVDVMLGVMSRYDVFYRELSELLDWEKTEAASLNRGKEDYASEYMSDGTALELIAELNAEDQKLLNHINDNHEGFYSNLVRSQPDIRLHRLKNQLRNRSGD